MEHDTQYKRYSRRYDESSRQMEDEERKKNDNRIRERQDNRRHCSQGWKAGATLPSGRKLTKPVKSSFDVSYTAPEDTVASEANIETTETEEDIKDNISKMVYQEGNVDVDPYNAIVDTGCPKTVCGRPFMDAFIASKGKNCYVRRICEDQSLAMDMLANQT